MTRSPILLAFSLGLLDHLSALQASALAGFSSVDRGADHHGAYTTTLPRRPRRQFPAPTFFARGPRAIAQRLDIEGAAALDGRPRNSRGRALPGGAWSAGHHRRRIPAHVLPYRFPGTARGSG